MNTCLTERSQGAAGKSGEQSDGGRKIKKVTVLPVRGPLQVSKQGLGLKSKKGKHNSKDSNVSKKLGKNNEKTRFIDSLRSEDQQLVDAKRGARFQPQKKSGLKLGPSRQRVSKSPNNPFRSRGGGEVSQERVRKISQKNLIVKDPTGRGDQDSKRQTGPQFQAIEAILPNSGEPAN